MASKTSKRFGKDSRVQKRRRKTHSFPVKSIKGFDVREGIPHYLIHWDMVDANDSWEPISNLSCDRIVREYHLKLNTTLGLTSSESEVKIYFYDIQIPNPTLFQKTMKGTSDLIYIKNDSYRQIYGDRERKIFAKHYKDTVAASSCTDTDFKLWPTLCTIQQLLPVEVSSKLLTAIDQSVLYCTDDLLAFPKSLAGKFIDSIKTNEVEALKSLFTLKHENFGEVTLNHILSDRLQEELEELGFWVWSQSQGSYKGFCLFSASRPGFCIIKKPSPDNNSMNMMVINEEEEDDENDDTENDYTENDEVYGIAGECRKGNFESNKQWQILAVMLLLLTELVIGHMSQTGCLVKRATVFGIIPNYKLNSATIYKLHVDFEKCKASAYHTEDTTTIAMALKLVLTWMMQVNSCTL